MSHDQAYYMNLRVIKSFGPPPPNPRAPNTPSYTHTKAQSFTCPTWSVFGERFCVPWATWPGCIGEGAVRCIGGWLPNTVKKTIVQEDQLALLYRWSWCNTKGQQGTDGSFECHEFHIIHTLATNQNTRHTLHNATLILASKIPVLSLNLQLFWGLKGSKNTDTRY